MRRTEELEHSPTQLYGPPAKEDLRRGDVSLGTAVHPAHERRVALAGLGRLEDLVAVAIVRKAAARESNAVALERLPVERAAIAGLAKSFAALHDVISADEVLSRCLPLVALVLDVADFKS